MDVYPHDPLDETSATVCLVEFMMPRHAGRIVQMPQVARPPRNDRWTRKVTQWRLDDRATVYHPYEARDDKNEGTY